VEDAAGPRVEDQVVPKDAVLADQEEGQVASPCVILTLVERVQSVTWGQTGQDRPDLSVLARVDTLGMLWWSVGEESASVTQNVLTTLGALTTSVRTLAKDLTLPVG